MTDDRARSGEPERRYQELRLGVQQRHAAAAALDDDAAELGTAVDQLVAAVDELVAFEDRLPVLRDLPARAVSVQLVRASALGALLGGVLILLGMWREALGWGWLSVVLVTLVAALRMVTLRVAPAAGGHRRQRYAAVACGGSGMLIGPVAALAGWLPGLACVVVHLLTLGILLELFDASRRVRGQA